MDSVSRGQVSGDAPERTRGNAHEVMDVENTVSPNMLVGAPNDRPVNDWPDLRCNTAGGSFFRGPAWDARPLESCGTRTNWRANMIENVWRLEIRSYGEKSTGR